MCLMKFGKVWLDVERIIFVEERASALHSTVLLEVYLTTGGSTFTAVLDGEDKEAFERYLKAQHELYVDADARLIMHERK